MKLPDTLPADLTVLVVDDDAFARKIVQRMLETVGVRNVLTAGDGAEALALIASGALRFDAVISDIHMPIMNGFELIDAARKIEPALPFIVITGDAREQAVAMARARDIAAFVVKPLSPAQIVEKLTGTLQRDPDYAAANWTRSAEGLAFKAEASETMRAIFDGWSASRTGGGLPPRATLVQWGLLHRAPTDRVTFSVEVTQPGPRFIYTNVGADLAAKLGYDPTGQYVDAQSFLHRRYALPAYERVAAARVPHFRAMSGIEGFFAFKYRRLMLPFGDASAVQTVLGCVDLL